MDINSLVEGGAQGLARIGSAFRDSGIPVSAVYLLKSSGENYTDWRIRLVTTAGLRNVVFRRIDLEREAKLPRIDKDVIITSISPSSWEATRILEYASKAHDHPVEIRNTGFDGVLIEYALVADWPAPDRAAA